MFAWPLKQGPKLTDWIILCRYPSISGDNGASFAPSAPQHHRVHLGSCQECFCFHTGTHRQPNVSAHLLDLPIAVFQLISRLFRSTASALSSPPESTAARKGFPSVSRWTLSPPTNTENIWSMSIHPAARSKSSRYDTYWCLRFKSKILGNQCFTCYAMFLSLKELIASWRQTGKRLIKRPLKTERSISHPMSPPCWKRWGLTVCLQWCCSDVTLLIQAINS